LLFDQTSWFVTKILHFNGEALFQNARAQSAYPIFAHQRLPTSLKG